MSLKIEIADWKLEFDLQGMTATPIERADKTKTTRNSGQRRSQRKQKRGINSALRENNQYQRETGGKKEWA
jgi:hypothetical protein